MTSCRASCQVNEEVAVAAHLNIARLTNLQPQWHSLSGGPVGSDFGADFVARFVVALAADHGVFDAPRREPEAHVFAGVEVGRVQKAGPATRNVLHQDDVLFRAARHRRKRPEDLHDGPHGEARPHVAAAIIAGPHLRTSALLDVSPPRRQGNAAGEVIQRYRHFFETNCIQHRRYSLSKAAPDLAIIISQAFSKGNPARYGRLLVSASNTSATAHNLPHSCNSRPIWPTG